MRYRVHAVMRAVSVGAMLRQLHGLCGTADVSAWEADFIKSVYLWSSEGKDTRNVSDKQLPIIERLYRKHFA